ncbi:MAG TPA: alpha-E domain-containing protein [Chthoniobacteraceae bacterium]|nr:alpha-E domain-containing protein [Chthoniobacteraceae bacterium]
MLSRVADSLFWLARYIERAENNSRILDVNLQVTLDDENTGELSESIAWEPILATLEDQKLFRKLYAVTNAEAVCEFVTFAKENPNSIRCCVSAARENARTVREYISSEMWERINSLYLWINSTDTRQLFASSAIDFYRHVVDYAHQFHGTTDATLTHGEGWNFLLAGKYLERADSASRILDLKYHILLPTDEQVGGNLDTVHWQAVLKSCSAFEAYRKLHTGQITPWSVAEFIILHDSFPRSIRYCADRLDTALHRISGCNRANFSTEAERLSGRLLSDLSYATISDLFQTGLHEYLDRTQGRLNEISGALLKQYCEWLDPELVAESQSQRS